MSDQPVGQSERSGESAWEYRVRWFNPTQHRVCVERAGAEWAARARAAQLVERGMEQVGLERRPVTDWEALGA